jgi:2-C-methyl-D-erythritol 4-phosphate cytidylyltransferase
VIVAAGRSRRTGSIDKLWTPLADAKGRSRPLLAYCVAAFQLCPAVGRIVIVVAEEAIERTQALAEGEGWNKVCAVAPGGDRRQDSVRAGMESLDRCEWVIVHDGARPMVTPALIEQGLREAQETGAACCALPVPDTVKESDDAGRIVRTLDRSRLWLAQTPQTFRYDLLMQAHDRGQSFGLKLSSEGEATDDAALVEALGVEVRLYQGSPRNLKVTTRDDLALAQALLATST